MQDLKAGHLVGATPYKQQIMQIIGVCAAAVAIAPVLSLLFNAYGLGDVFPREGMDVSEALKAPQATLMSSVADGVFNRNLPIEKKKNLSDLCVSVVKKILANKRS